MERLWHFKITTKITHVSLNWFTVHLRKVSSEHCNVVVCFWIQSINSANIESINLNFETTLWTNMNIMSLNICKYGLYGFFTVAALTEGLMHVWAEFSQPVAFHWLRTASLYFMCKVVAHNSCSNLELLATKSWKSPAGEYR